MNWKENGMHNFLQLKPVKILCWLNSAVYSEVFELIEDIHNSFNFNICVLSFTDLLVMAVSVINSGKEISIQNFRTLKGVYNVKKLNNN